MPFASLERPSLGVSLLKARLLEEGVACDVRYLNVAFAELLGPEEYERMLEGLPFRALPGEWVFADCMWGRAKGLPVTYLEDVLRDRWHVAASDIDLVRQARDLAPGFLKTWAGAIPWAAYDVVGFSSYTAQNLASLALARLAKEAHPVIQIVFGGANWHGAPGPALHGHLPFVDFAISGEADHSFPQLVRHLAGDPTVELGGIPGLIRRTGPTTCVAAEEEPVPDLDALPVPDFSDFYEARHSNPGVRATLPSLTVETSRGCWWATTGPCTFCGMDRRERVYRAKSPRRILEELRTLAALWPCSSIHLADTVVSEGFLDDVLPALAIEPRARRLFFEVRPTLSKAQVDSIAAARAEIQPGIESFSGHVLRLMHKGTGVLENIRLLKWCRAAGVDVSWNLLHGLPGETQEDYEAMFAILPSIRFLAPPQSTQPVTVDRYSPYFEAPESYGIAELRPLDPYRYLYPFPARDLADIAYSFGFACAPGQALPDVGAALETEAGLWRRESSKGCLRVLEDTGDCITLSDRRACATAPIVELDGLESILYAACDDIASRLELAPHIHRRSGGRVDQATIDAALESLVARRLMVAVGERYLSLALPATS